MDVMVPGQETEQEEMPDNTCHQPVSSPLPGSHVDLSVPFGRWISILQRRLIK